MPQTNYVRSFACLAPGSLVYANPEPKKIEDIRPGDHIIGVDGRSHRVRKLIRKNHDGYLVGIKARYLPPVAITPDHPVLVVRSHPGVGKSRSRRRVMTFRNNPSPTWVRADGLKRGDYVFFPKYRYVSRQKYIWIGHRRFEISEKLASVLGWYVAEGSPADSVERNIGFSLGAKDEKHVETLRKDLIDLFGAKTSVYSNAQGTKRSVIITSSRTSNLLRTLKLWCGDSAESKRIPEFIMNAEINVLKAFMRSYFRGDGYSPVYTGKEHRYIDFIDDTTSSVILAYQLMLAFSKLGMPAEFVKHEGSVNVGYSVRVRGDKVRSMIQDFPSFNKVNKFHYWETAEGFYYPINQLWLEEYDGPVYDFQAPGFTMLSPFATQDCVTKWTIKDVQWEGLPIKNLVQPAGIRPGATWIMFHCAEGYTTPVPLEYAIRDDALLAFKIDGKPLSAEQGFPARPFFPNLYGWKSAKWVNRMELIPQYRDGYWEAYGYHERADIWEEERFKGHVGKAVARKAFGTA